MENQVDNNFEEDYEEDSKNLQNVLTIVAVVIAAVSFISLSWYAYNSYTSDNEGDIPVISADSTPIKVIPEDPGGMNIPNMDKNVYNKLASDKEKHSVERLLPPPEQAMEKEEIEKRYSTDEDVSKSVEVAEKIEKETVTPSVEESANDTNVTNNAQNDQSFKDTTEIKNNDLSNVKQEVLVASTQEQKREVVTQATPTIKNIPVGSRFASADFNGKTVKKGYRVQIASFKSVQDVEKGWQTQKKASGGLLDGYNYHMERKNLANKGVVYRLQVGNFKSEVEAYEFCKKLKNKNVDCFVARP
jgi:cell division septation protein DedD